MKTYSTLAGLLASLKSGDEELSDDLPVFGDPQWNNPVGVWSWDDTDAIVGTCADDLRIVPKSDL